MSQLKPEVFLEAMRLIHKGGWDNIYTCLALSDAERNLGMADIYGTHRAAYEGTFAPTDEERQAYLRDYKREVDSYIWMDEYRPGMEHLTENVANKRSIKRERLTFLAMAHALAQAGDL